jgi:hypothetical protein
VNAQDLLDVLLPLSPAERRTKLGRIVDPDTGAKLSIGDQLALANELERMDRERGITPETRRRAELDEMLGFATHGESAELPRREDGSVDLDALILAGVQANGEMPGFLEPGDELDDWLTSKKAEGEAALARDREDADAREARKLEAERERLGLERASREG